MKIKWIIFGYLVAAGNLLWAQNAPVTTAGVVGTAVSGQQVHVPITISNFTDIGSLNLTLDYTASSLTYQSETHNPAFSGLSVNSSTSGRIIITWTGVVGYTLPDQTQLLNITFIYLSGTSPLTWNTSGTSCQYKKFANGSYTVLNDLPKSAYYVDGFVAARVAPKTYAPVITNAVPGTLYLPITVKNFVGISSLYLMFTYDINTLTYKNSFTVNPGLPGDFQVGSQNGPPGKKFLIISWFGNPDTLSDGSTLVTLKFTYTSTAGNGNFSPLTWYECGPCCEYTDVNSTVLYDSPAGDYYLDGLVTSQVSPVTLLPTMGDASSGNTSSVPVLVNGFTNISAFSLAFKYDPAVLTLPSGAYTPNPALGGGLVATNAPAGSDGKRTIVIGWSGTPKTLPAGSPVVTFDFVYNSGTTALKWCTGSDSCKYNDALNNTLWKTPVGQYFNDGAVASHLAPKIRAEIGAGMTGQTIIVPVTVTNFTNIGSFTLTLNYDPGVVQYQSSLPVSTIGGSFTSVLAGPGQLVMNWTGPVATLPDGTLLIELSFMYIGGSGSLQWFSSGNSCLFNEGTTMVPLYDQPKTTYYTNGSILPGKYLNVSLLPEGLYAGNGSLFKAQDEMGDHFPENTADLVTVEMHNPSDYSEINYRAIKTGLTTEGAAHAVVPATFTTSSYITIKHRNSIETVSAEPVSFEGNPVAYTFDNATKAYGYNMVQMVDGFFVIFSGDSNQDSIVDGSDISDIGNLAATGTTGYIPEDLNGDGLVDGSDLSLVSNNADDGIGAMYP